MNILTITGDKNFKPGNARFDLQAGKANLTAVYWGRGSTAPAIPPGSYDIVVAQDPFWRGLFALRLARRLGVPLRVELHTDLRAQSFVKRVVARRVLKAAQSVRVVSQMLKQQVEALGIGAPIVVLPIFVDVAPFARLAHERHPAFQHTILWFGRFEAEKDPLKAISILADVRRDMPNTGLVMLGKGTVEPLLKKRVHKLGLTGWVDFPGWQPPAKYVAQADVVVCTSQFEGFGASIIEALAAGVPVVAPDVGVAREAGATVVPREKLAQAALGVLRSPYKAELKLPMHSAKEWAEAWAASFQTKNTA